MLFLSGFLSGLSFSVPYLEFLIIPSLAMLFLNLGKKQSFRSRVQNTSFFFLFTFLAAFHSMPVAVHNYFQCSWPTALLISLSLQSAFMFFYLALPWACFYRWRELEIPLWKLGIVFFIPLFPLNLVFPFHYGYQLLNLNPWINFWVQIFGFLNLSLWTLAFSVSTALILAKKRSSGILAALALLAFLFAGSFFNRQDQGEPQKSLSYAILQPNFSKEDKELARKDPLVAARQLDQLLGFSFKAVQTSRESSEPLRLLLWPETILSYIFHADGGPQEDFMNRLQSFVDQNKIYLGTGVFVEQNGKIQNSVIFLQPHGLPQIYSKRKLFPLGEEVPFLPQSVKSLLFPNLPQLDPAQNSAVLFSMENILFQPFICYESMFTGLLNIENKKAAFLVHFSEDSWFMPSFEPEQHWNILRMRAIEHEQNILRVTNSGYSGVIKSNGQTEKESLLGQPEIILGKIEAVPGPSDISRRTFYSQYETPISLVFDLILFVFLII
ncbi:MAG: apolipoprotein N-acyltransferase [Pseudobdellovibrionaceae bacterium]